MPGPLTRSAAVFQSNDGQYQTQEACDPISAFGEEIIFLLWQMKNLIY